MKFLIWSLNVIHFEVTIINLKNKNLWTLFPTIIPETNPVSFKERATAPLTFAVTLTRPQKMNVFNIKSLLNGKITHLILEVKIETRNLASTSKFKNQLMKLRNSSKEDLKQLGRKQKSQWQPQMTLWVMKAPKIPSKTSLKFLQLHRTKLKLMKLKGWWALLKVKFLTKNRNITW